VHPRRFAVATRPVAHPRRRRIHHRRLRRLVQPAAPNAPPRTSPTHRSGGPVLFPTRDRPTGRLTKPRGCMNPGMVQVALDPKPGISARLPVAPTRFPWPSSSGLHGSAGEIVSPRYGCAPSAGTGQSLPNRHPPRALATRLGQAQVLEGGVCWRPAPAPRLSSPAGVAPASRDNRSSAGSVGTITPHGSAFSAADGRIGWLVPPSRRSYALDRGRVCVLAGA